MYALFCDLLLLFNITGLGFNHFCACGLDSFILIPLGIPLYGYRRIQSSILFLGEELQLLNCF